MIADEIASVSGFYARIYKFCHAFILLTKYDIFYFSTFSDYSSTSAPNVFLKCCNAQACPAGLKEATPLAGI